MAVRIGDVHVGVRATDPSLDEVLRALLAAHVEADVDVPTNYLARLAEAPKNTRATGFHLLHHGNRVVLRTRDLERLVHGLLSHLDSGRRVDDGMLLAQGVALVGERGALVAPALLRQYLAQLERRLNVRGIRIADPPSVSIDWQDRVVVVPKPALDIDWSSMDQLSSVAPGAHTDPAVPPGRYPMTGWAFLTAEPGSPPSRGQAIAMAARLTTAPESMGLQEILDALTHLMRGVEPARLVRAEPKALAAPLLELMGAGS